MADIFDLFKQISKKETAPAGPVTWLIVGLGNPGEKYAHTHHNAGFLAMDYLSQKVGVKVDRLKFHALCAEATVGGEHVLLMKPQTLMNASGTAVGEAAEFYKIPPERVLVISDDINLAPGRIRVRKKGSHGGQNGLKDIIKCLGTEDFPRVRVGVGMKPHPDYDLADWVLSEFRKEEEPIMFEAFACVYDGIVKILSGDFDGAVQLCNSHLPSSETV